MASKKVTISLVTLLLLSMAGNLFFAGLVAGRAMHANKRMEQAMERDKALRTQIPDQDRKTMRKMMREKLPEFKNAKAGFEKAQRKLLEAAATDPLDEAALRAAVEELTALQSQMQNAMAESVLEAAPQLSAEGRKAMVSHILFREGAKGGRDRDAMRDRVRDKFRDRIRQRMMEEGQDGAPRARARAFGGPDFEGRPEGAPVPPDMDYPPPPPPQGFEPGMDGDMPPPPPPGFEPGMEGGYPPPPPPPVHDMDVDAQQPLMPPAPE